mmetsp:Transcript_10408/g.20530  ORF Transcript_10408/g.20530 Transcript_10408/m.20530 type:complete len:115 (+) Transcript_10408:408-752(+)
MAGSILKTTVRNTQNCYRDLLVRSKNGRPVATLEWKSADGTICKDVEFVIGSIVSLFQDDEAPSRSQGNGVESGRSIGNCTDGRIGTRVGASGSHLWYPGKWCDYFGRDHRACV